MKRAARGDRVGRYQVLGPLTEGGMAELFLGAATGPGGFQKKVVIKRIRADASSDETFVRMFLDEARITAALSHPNIAQVFDLGEDEHGLYVVMEFIDGQNLNQVITACASQQRVLPLGFSVSVVNDCAAALHAAHTAASPVIHRDVAPKNVMVGYDGRTRLLDFGIAKAANALSRTSAGTVKGTAGYLAPEQARGLEVDARADVFSLGVMLWELVTGQRLFAANTELLEVKSVLEKPAPRPETVEPVVPSALGDVVMQALEKDPSKRHASARDFSKALTHACPELLVEVEDRATFMRSLFQGELRPVEPEALAPTFVRPKASKKPKVTAEDERLLELALEVDRVAAGAEVHRRPGPPLGPLVLGGLVLVLGLALANKVLFPERRVSSEGLLLWEGEPDQPPPDVLAIPGAPPEDKAPVVLVPAESEPIDQKEPEVKKVARPRGEVTLAFPDGATVFRGKERLGEGTLVTVNLAAGLHHLTIVGPDKVRRRLPLQMEPGKMRAQRFGMNDLPPE